MAAQLEVALGGTGWAAPSNKKRKSGAAAGYWEEEREMVVQLMMGRPHHLDVNRPSFTSAASAPAHAAPFPRLNPPSFCTTTTTLDLLGSSSSSSARPAPPPLPFPCEDASSSSCCFDLDSPSPLPSGWEKCLDLQTGSIYYLNRSTGLSTSCDPRKANTSSANWPTSPSTSSDLTFEANVPMASSSKPLITTNLIEGLNYESTNLDLTLSLKPSSRSVRPNSLNHSLNHDAKSELNHNLRSLISSQGLLNNQNFASSGSSLPFNSTRDMKATLSCTSLTTTTPSSPSTLIFQDLNELKDMGSLGSSNSSKESKIMGMSTRPMNNDINMNGRDRPITKPITSDTHMNANSPMITVGCANCLMFVMLPRSCSPKCPRCGASIDSDLPLPPSIKKPKLGFSLLY